MIKDRRYPQFTRLKLLRTRARALKTPRLIFGCDEESGWEYMEYYAQKVGMPDMGFSPDADYPIINTEKGIYHAQLKKSLIYAEIILCPYTEEPERT